MAQSGRWNIVCRILVVSSCILVASALALPESPIDATSLNDAPSKPDAKLTDLVAPIDDIEDMETIFENYERQYNSHDDLGATNDQLLVEPSSLDETFSRHIISSRASNPHQLEDASGNGPVDEASEAVATVRSLIEGLGDVPNSDQSSAIVDVASNTSSERENRTIIVVVTTNIINNKDDKDNEERSKEQHSQLSFGLNNLIPLLPTVAPQPRLELHNQITTEFFNAELSEKIISVDGVARSIETADIPDRVTEITKVFTDSTRTETISEEITTILPNVHSDQSTELASNYSSPPDTHSNDGGPDGIDNFNKNSPDDRIPDIIESMPHEEVREKYIQDIPREEHIPMVSKVENPLGIHVPSDNRRAEDVSEYVVEDLPVDEDAGRVAEAIIIDVDNVVPDRCKVLVDDVVYGTKECFNDTDMNALSRISRQLGDFNEEVELESSKRRYNFSEAQQMIPRTDRHGSQDHIEDMRFMDYLHNYLLQYMGRSYLDNSDLRLRFDRLVAKKHVLETVRAGSIRDIGDYIEKTTYFNFPNHSSRIPEYLLSGDREKDQQKLDRLQFNKRYSAELWTRVLQADDKEDKNTKSSMDLSAISIDQLRNNKTDFTVELSAVANETKDILLVREKAGTVNETDVLTFNMDKDDVWAHGDGKVPWYRMSPEERMDVEFAAYMHALIDTRREILPRTAYFIRFENPDPSLRKRPQQVDNLSAPIGGEDRKARNIPVHTPEGSTRLMDNILRSGGKVLTVGVKTEYRNGVKHDGSYLLSLNPEKTKYNTAYLLKRNRQLNKPAVKVEEVEEEDDDGEEYEEGEEDEDEEGGNEEDVKPETENLKDGVTSTENKGKKVSDELSPISAAAAIVNVSQNSSRIERNVQTQLETTSPVYDEENQTQLPDDSDIVVPSTDTVKSDLPTEIRTDIHQVQSLETITVKPEPLDVPATTEIANSPTKLTIADNSTPEESPLEIVQYQPPKFVEPLELLTGEFLMVGGRSSIKKQITSNIVVSPIPTIDDSNLLDASSLMMDYSSHVENTPTLTVNTPAAQQEADVDVEGSGNDNPTPSSNSNQEIDNSQTVTDRNLEFVDEITPHKIIKKNGPLKLDDSSEESNEVGRSNTDDDLKSSRAADLLRTVVEAVEISADLSKSLDNFRGDLLENGALRQARSQTSASPNILPVPNELGGTAVSKDSNDKPQLMTARTFDAQTVMNYGMVIGLIVLALIETICVMCYFAFRSCDRYDLVIMAGDGTA